jgi:hypothetical protein
VECGEGLVERGEGLVECGEGLVECGECHVECEGVASLILRRFSAQERNTDKIIPTVLYCAVFHSQNTVQYNCTRYNLV